MPIARMDHFTILTTDAEKTVAFYNDILGFTPGPRPAFSFPGAWLYNDGKAVLHVVRATVHSGGGGVLDHIAFFGTDPSAYVAKLKARGIKHDLRRLPAERPRGRRLAIVLLRSERRAGRDRLCGERDGGGARASACAVAPSLSLAIEPGRPVRAAAGSGTSLCATIPSFRSARGRTRPALARSFRWRSSPGLASSRAGPMRSRWRKPSRRSRTRRAIGLVFKSSFDKANRTSGSAKRGMGLKAALPIFAEIRETLGLPVITDVHESSQCGPVAQAVDALQIPAFLCRQTDLLVAAAETGRPVNVKKGQFLAPWDMKNVVAKLDAAGFGRHPGDGKGRELRLQHARLRHARAADPRRETGAPVIFDATHSVQQPGGQGTASGGEREFVRVLARAAVAVGVAGVFIETHQDPDHAPSDGPNMVPLKDFEALVAELQDFDRLAKRNGENA